MAQVFRRNPPRQTNESVRQCHVGHVGRGSKTSRDTKAFGDVCAIDTHGLLPYAVGQRRLLQTVQGPCVTKFVLGDGRER